MRHEAMLWEKTAGGRVRCLLCAHNCVIDSGEFGFCGVRQNIDGSLFTCTYGNAVAKNIDPIEKKPLYHFLPGSNSYSIAAAGCNFRCGFCQNWSISQLSAEDGDKKNGYELTPDDIVKEAADNGCKSISYTYTEPTVFFEYAYDTAVIAKKNGLYNIFVTNGFMTGKAIDAIGPWLDAANVDLKFFSDETYRKVCRGRLGPVLESIKHMKNAGIHLEITTLVVPGLNDSAEELRGIASFIAGLDKGIPWHISRFHPDYMRTDLLPTPVKTLESAKKTGEEEGLEYIYLGNVYPGGDTVCPGCKSVLIWRSGFTATKTGFFSGKGRCLRCGTVISGSW